MLLMMLTTDKLTAGRFPTSFYIANAFIASNVTTITFYAVVVDDHDGWWKMTNIMRDDVG